MHILNGTALTLCRCSHIVTDRFGTCNYCGENAYQCRHCRSINYDHLDGFLCVECGYSRYGRFDFSLRATVTRDYSPLRQAPDLVTAMQDLVVQTKEIDTRSKNLQYASDKVLEMLGHSGLDSPNQRPENVGKDRIEVQPVDITVLRSLYMTECREAYENLLDVYRSWCGIKDALQQYTQQAFLTQSSQDKVTLYDRSRQDQVVLWHIEGGHASMLFYVEESLKWLLALCQSSPQTRVALMKAGAASAVLQNHILFANRKSEEIARKLLLEMGRDLDNTPNSVGDELSRSLLETVEQRLRLCIGQCKMVESVEMFGLDMTVLINIAEREVSDISSTGSDTESSTEGNDSLLATQLVVATLRAAVESAKPFLAATILLPCLHFLCNSCEVVMKESGEPELSKAADGALRSSRHSKLQFILRESKDMARCLLFNLSSTAVRVQAASLMRRPHYY